MLIKTHGTQGKGAAIVWTGKGPAPPHKPLSRGVYAAGEYTSSACVFDKPHTQCQAHTSHSALPIGGQLLAPTTQRSMPDVGWPTTAEHSEGRDEESCWKPPLILPWLKNSPAHTKAIPHKEPGKISTRRAVPSHTTFFVLLSARDLSPACPPPMLLLPPHKTLLLQSRARGTQDQLTHVFCFPPPLSRPRLL